MAPQTKAAIIMNKSPSKKITAVAAPTRANPAAAPKSSPTVTETFAASSFASNFSVPNIAAKLDPSAASGRGTLPPNPSPAPDASLSSEINVTRADRARSRRARACESISSMAARNAVAKARPRMINKPRGPPITGAAACLGTGRGIGVSTAASAAGVTKRRESSPTGVRTANVTSSPGPTKEVYETRYWPFNSVAIPE